MAQRWSTLIMAACAVELIASIGLAQCLEWRALPEEVSGGADVPMTAWDPDGTGPMPECLVTRGNLSLVGCWDGTTWQELGSAVSTGSVLALTTWDPDGDGPLGPVVVAGGAFTVIGGSVASRVAMWNGSTWNAIGGGLSGTVEVLTTWDPDGSGPLNPRLIAAGNLSFGGVKENRVVQWDGSSWQPIGSWQGSPSAMISWDPDGSGPAQPQLVVAGRLLMIGGGAVNGIARWDGNSWHPFGSDVDRGIQAITLWDRDGSGPQAPLLVIGGGIQGLVPRFVWTWELTHWATVGMSFNQDVLALGTYDIDGNGPQAPTLVASGPFSAAGGVPVHAIAQWNGQAWSSMGEGFRTAGSPTGRVNALVTVALDASAPNRRELIAGGSFCCSGSLQLNSIARWSTRPPTVTTSPAAQTVCTSQVSATLTVAASKVGPEPATFAWYRNGQFLTDGATSTGSFISGATTASLTISNPGLTDEGSYSCSVGGACGVSDSAEAFIDIRPNGDIVGDGSVGLDDVAFVISFWNQPVPAGSGADVDGDGFVGLSDLAVLITNWATTCP